MTCRDVTGYLREHAATELHAEDQAEFDAHVAACDNCREYVREYVLAIDAARAAFGARPPGEAPTVPREMPDDAFVTSVLADLSSTKDG